MCSQSLRTQDVFTVKLPDWRYLSQQVADLVDREIGPESGMRTPL
jgi:hypothetical protein